MASNSGKFTAEPLEERCLLRLLWIHCHAYEIAAILHRVELMIEFAPCLPSVAFPRSASFMRGAAPTPLMTSYRENGCRQPVALGPTLTNLGESAFRRVCTEAD